MPDSGILAVNEFPPTTEWDSDEEGPVPELAELNPELTPGLEEAVLHAIRRRESAAYAVGFAFGGLTAVFRAVAEWLTAVLDTIDSHDDERADS